MNSKYLMSAAAIVLGLGGISCIFLPNEICRLLIQGGGDREGLIVQLVGAGFLGFAALDWVSRGALLGGIYGRPVVGANYTHFFIGTLLLLREAVRQPGSLVSWCTLAVYTLFAAGFAMLFFGPPPRKDSGSST